MKPTVMVVDDEAPIRNMLAFSLGRAEMDVVTASGGEAALCLLGETRPDLILIDWMMPDLNGLQLTRRLRQDPTLRDIPIIMLTARGNEDERTRGLDAGADDYVVKPFSTRELIARVRAVLRRVSPVDETGRITISGHRPAPRPGRLQTGQPGTDGIPPAALLHEPLRPGVEPRTAAGSCLGQPQFRRGTHRGRPYPTFAQGAGGKRLSPLRADRARPRLSFLRRGLA